MYETILGLGFFLRFGGDEGIGEIGGLYIKNDYLYIDNC